VGLGRSKLFRAFQRWILLMHYNVQELGRIFFRVGSLSFGGGNANIAALRQELVERREWLTPAQFNLCYTLSRVAPGTNLLAFCVAVGWVLLGRAGALVAVLALSLPSAVIVVALTSLYESYGRQATILTITRWLLAATIGIIAASAWALVRPALGRRRWVRAVIIVVGAFALNSFLSISPLKVLLAAALVGGFWPERKEK
jgi:chromate transporter